MKLRIRYDETVQTLDLDEKSTEQLWVSLSLEGKELSDSEKEQKIQEAFDIQYNRPEYNNWHKFDRHRGNSKTQSATDNGEEDTDTSEPLMSEVADDRIFRKDEIDRDERESYEAICGYVRKVLAKKPEWTDAFIAVRMDEETIREYAARIGADENNITQKLKRAEKKLAAVYKKSRESQQRANNSFLVTPHKNPL